MKKVTAIVHDVKAYAFTHKIISSLVIFGIALGTYSAVKVAQSGSQTTKYVLSPVSRGTIVSAVTGSGQISANEEVVVASKVSGALTSLPVTDGEKVVEGQLLASVDATDAARTLESAQIALAKLEESPATTTLTSTENAVVTSYSSAWNDMTMAFVNLPAIISGIDGMLNKQGQYLSDSNSQYFNDTGRSLRNDALTDDALADENYQASLALYKTLTRQSATSSLEALLESVYTTMQSVSQTIKDERTAVQFIEANVPAAYQSQAESALSTLNTWSDETSGYTSTLLSDKNSIAQSNESLDALVGGPDALDIQSQQLSIQAAEESYGNYFIHAPLSGTLSLAVKPTDTISSGTTIGTIISKEKISVIALNEIDAAKVKVGDKATITFDAINGLSIAGHVSDVSVIGAVSQGVVTYNVTITLDTDDDRIKPGMSVNASIVTDVESDVLTVPNAAVKMQGGTSYVEELAGSVPAAQAAAGVASLMPPKNIPVTIGISNGTMTEILSGLSEGDQIITKTITSSGGAATQAAAAAPSLFGGGGGRGGFGGGARGL
jgi:HlyD family secretion protein